MADYKYVIIGGGLAGGRACEGIRQVDTEGSIALITREQYIPYQRPPLSKAFLRKEAGIERVYLRDDDYYAGNQIDIIQNNQVLRIDRDRRHILADRGLMLGYEKLLLATGGNARRLNLPGNELGNVFTLRTIDDSLAIQEAGGKGKTALVMGGSFIGSEVAASLSALGTQVIVVFPGSRLLEKIVPEAVSAYIHELYEQHGIRIYPKTVANSLEGTERVSSAKLDNGEVLSVDLAVMGVGIDLNTGLAREAGLELRKGDQAVIVDEYLRTSDPHIYAAGDIAAWPDPTFGQRLRVEHWDVARRQGRHAGRNMAGEGKPYTALPYFYSDLFDLSFEVWGNLHRWDQTVTRGSIEDGSFAIYYFDQNRLTGVFTTDRPDEERKPMQALIKARPKYDEVAADLENQATDLAELAGMEPQTEAQEVEADALSFSEDIAPLFRDWDVEKMKDISDFDLSDYEDVRARATHIYERLEDKSMPCDGPWPEEQIETFKRWMEGGMQP